MSFDIDSVNLKRILHVILYRKNLILFCYVLTISFVMLLTFFTPKKYISSAKLLINSSNSTNLSDFNPFVLSNSEQGVASLYSASESLADEVELIKSNLVLEPIIIEKNMKYKEGRRKGNYISIDDLLANLEIKNFRGSNVIEISYKSSSPELSYTMVNEIIKKYMDVFERINIQKASKDKNFLEKEYQIAKKSVDAKISKMKYANSNINSGDGSSKSTLFEMLLGKYDKRINSDLNANVRAGYDNKKLNLELEQDVEKLKMLKSKYDWSSLVETMSKSTTKVVIIKKPQLKNKNEFYEPRIYANFLFSLILGMAVSFLAVLTAEKTAKHITFLSLKHNSILSEINEIDFSAILIDLNNNNYKKISIISLLEKDEEKNIFENIKNILGNKKFVFDLTNNGSTIYEHIENMNSSDYIVFLTKIGYSDSKLYENIAKISQKLSKKSLEYVFFDK